MKLKKEKQTTREREKWRRKRIKKGGSERRKDEMHGKQTKRKKREKERQKRE